MKRALAVAAATALAVTALAAPAVTAKNDGNNGREKVTICHRTADVKGDRSLGGKSWFSEDGQHFQLITVAVSAKGKDPGDPVGPKHLSHNHLTQDDVWDAKESNCVESPGEPG